MKPKVKRRAWFQLHLSTCVMLMLVASILLWLNLSFENIDLLSPGESFDSDGLSSDQEMDYRCKASRYGWPFSDSVNFGVKYVEEGFSDIFYDLDMGGSGMITIKGKPDPKQALRRISKEHQPKNLIYNVFVGLGILIIVCILSESLNRRRERKEQDQGREQATI